MGSLKVITYDVEHGSCHVLITPNNQIFMIDAGSTENFSPALHLKNNWGVTSLRWLTVTHHDADHLTDINSIVEHLPPGTITQPALTKDELSSLYAEEFSTPLDAFLTFVKEKYTMPALPISDLSYDWGGVQFATFSNKIADLKTPNINDLSVVTFASYQGWTFLFPGDLETQGWLKLLENESFREFLGKTDVLIASHHGRLSGFCEEMFKYCSPFLTIISDKSISDTSCTDKYYPKSKGLQVENPLGASEKRYVLTTRDDGAIYVDIDSEGKYKINLG